MKAYSMDLRERIVAARRGRESVESVAQRFGVCSKTVRVYEKRAAQGRLCPTPRLGKAQRLDARAQEALVALVKARSDWTLPALSQAWHERTGHNTGHNVPPTTWRDTLHRLQITHKKRVALPANVVQSKNVVQSNGLPSV